jgi:6-phosphogluconate dehydrogenase
VVDSLEQLAGVLDRPRRILLMVAASSAVDDRVDQLKPFLEPGDILIDDGNSYFLDTERRIQALSSAGLNFIGMGVSGGESGALWVLSIMPGGSLAGWEALAPILKAIAVRAAPGTTSKWSTKGSNMAICS